MKARVVGVRGNGNLFAFCERCGVEHEVAETPELADVPEYKRAAIIAGAREFAASTLVHACKVPGALCVWEEIDDSEPGHVLNMGWHTGRDNMTADEVVVLTWIR